MYWKWNWQLHSWNQLGLQPLELQMKRKPIPRHRNRILYEMDLKNWGRRKHNLEINLQKVRSMIWDKFTSKTMKDKLEPMSDFTAKLSRDPVALLLAIKVQMHDTVRAQYSEWTRITATEKFFAFRQQDLTLADYITHFKELRDIFVTQNGSGFNDSMSRILLKIFRS